MRWRLDIITLKSQIILLITISIAIIIIIQFVFICMFFTINQSNYSAFLENTIVQLDDSLQSFNNRLEDVAKIISFNQNTFSYVNNGYLSEKVKLSENLNLMIESIKASNSNVLAILLTNFDMVDIGDVSSQSLYVKSQLKIMYENGELYGEETRHMTLYNPTDEVFCYISITPSFYMNDGTQRLFTVIFYSTNSWKSSMYNIGWNEGSTIVLLDTVGNILGRSRNADRSIETVKNLSYNMYTLMDAEDGLHPTRNAFYYKHTIDHLNWMIIGTVPKSVIKKDLSSLVYSSIIMLLIITVILIIQGWFMNHNITSPITQMTNFMDGINSNTDISQKLVVKNDNEIGRLANEINSMLIRINQMTNEMIEAKQQVYEAKMVQQESEIAAFQSQVNPHFLYNTLDCIQGISYSRGVPEIAQMVRSMAYIFRYSIKESYFVKVKDEISCIIEYMKIIQIRYSNRFTINYDVSPEVLDILIPKMILQPLVENAVFHGLEQITEGGMLSIKGRIEVSGCLVFEIEDNGAGIDDSTLSRIKLVLVSSTRSLGSDENETIRNIGLININRRIRILYGDECCLEVESTQGKYTKVTLSLPINI